MKSVIIIGASGYGKVVADIIQKSGDRVLGFLDDNLELPDTFIELPLLGTVENYKKYKDVAEFVIAIGNAAIREKIVKKLNNILWYTAIHPTAVISGINVRIAEGAVVMANTVVNSGSSIGKHCIINSGAVVEHDNMLEDFVHVSVGARLAGTVSIGKATWIGIGASVSNNLNICENCIIGAGAVVINDIKEAGTYIGIPAEKMEKTIMNTKKILRGGVIPPNYSFILAFLNSYEEEYIV